MKNIVKNLFVAVLFSLASLAFAQGEPAGPPPTPAQHFLKGLGLTDAQVTAVEDILAKTRAAVRVDRAQIRVLSAQINLAMTSPTPDLKAADTLVDKRAQTRSDMEKLILAAEAQVHQLVGDQIFYELKVRFLGRFGDRSDRRFGGPAGGPGPQFRGPEPVKP